MGTMIFNLSQAFLKSGALRRMPQLKAAPREITGEARKSMRGMGSEGPIQDCFLNEPFKIKF